jgi:serine/threonine protein kinase
MNINKQIRDLFKSVVDNLNPGKVIITKSDPIIGKGSFGEVTQGNIQKLFTKQAVAIKKLKLASGDELTAKEVIDRFENEAAMMKEITYKLYQAKAWRINIPRYIDFFSVKKDLYIVQEFIEGENLKVRCDRQKLSEEEIIQLLRDILSALDFVHQSQIVHRDISQTNIILSKTGKFNLIDFGAAKKIDQVNTGTVVSHGSYTPKEQLNGQAQFPSDIYALGIAAIKSYLGSSHRLEPLTEAIAALNDSKMNPELVLVLEKMTQENLQDRYYSVFDTLEALEKITGTVVIGSKWSSQESIIEDMDDDDDNDDGEIIINIPAKSPIHPGTFKLLVGSSLAIVAISFAITKHLSSTKVAGGTQAPKIAGGTQAPAVGGNTQVPTVAGGTQVPTVAGGTQVPTVAGGTQAPAVGGNTQAPTVAGGTQVPTVAGGTQAPAIGGNAQTPAVAGGTQVPTVAGGTQAPAIGGNAQAPAVGGNAQAPAVAGNAQAPAVAGGNQKPTAPKKLDCPVFTTKAIPGCSSSL